MAYSHTAHARDFHATETARKPGLFFRFFAKLMEARMRHAEQEVARYLHGTGYKFTDEAEREIERRFLGRPGL